jgi:hypothetical protein
MELPTVFVVVAKSEQKPVAAYLDTAMRHWLDRAYHCERGVTHAVADSVRAQLKLLLRVHADQETDHPTNRTKEVRSTLHLPTARIKFVIQSEAFPDPE